MMIDMIDRAMSGARQRIICVKCKSKKVYVSPKGVVGKLCAECFLVAFSELPDPDCERCYGEGEYYWHGDDCANEFCCLAGGDCDCKGKMIDCDCSLIGVK